MKQFTIRLTEGKDVKQEIERVVLENNIQAGVILAAVGGLQNAVFRLSKLPNSEHPIKEIEGPLEIVSCSGTLSKEGCHIHLSVSDREGNCYGGHLKKGSTVFVTVELVFGVFEDVVYKRIFDEQTGFKELSLE